MTFEIRFAESKDIPELIAFFTKVYKPGHIMTDRSYLDWQYFNTPYNFVSPKYSNLILFNNGIIAGHLGLIPYEMNVGGKKTKATFLASLVVEPELRSKGAGVFLSQEAEKYFDILYTTGFNEKAAPAFQYLSWGNEATLKRFVALRPEGFLGDGVKRIELFKEEWDADLKDLGKSYVTIERTSNYLNWRFANHPKIKYGIFAHEDKKCGGYILVRMEKGEEYVGARIVDFLASQKAALPLLQTAMQYAVENRATFVDFFCTSPPAGGFPYSEVLPKVGLKEWNPELDAEPPLFILPVDRKRKTINWSYKVVSKGLDIKPVDWYITKADGDKDRAY